MARELALDGAVDWLGFQPHAIVVEELRHATVFVQPSRTASNGDTEGGAPTTLIEAQAIGVPIVTTRHADIPHVVPEGAGARLVAERDVEGLASAILQLVDRPTASGWSSVSERHDVRVVIHALEACYREAIAQVT